MWRKRVEKFLAAEEEDVIPMPQVPARTTSKYAGQYAGTWDAERIVVIFTDSFKIALESKNPATATDRFALAVEAYHQLMTMSLLADVRGSVQAAMDRLVDVFPAQVVANEALGLREKAQKLKTPRKKLEVLNRAREILTRGLSEHPSNDLLRTAAAEVTLEIDRVETSTS